MVVDAAAASRSRPLAAARLGLKVGSEDKVAKGGRVRRGVGPAPAAWMKMLEHNCGAVCQGVSGEQGNGVKQMGTTPRL